MLITRSNIPSLLRPDLAAVFWDYNTYPAIWKEIFKVLRSDKSAEYELEMQGLGLGRLKQDGSPVEMSSFQQAYTTSYVHQYFGIAYSISRAAMKDNLYKQNFAGQAEMMRKSLETVKNYNAASVFNNGFNVNFPVSDGKSLFAEDHPIATGTLANTFTNGVGFTETAVEQAITLIRSWKNAAGLQLDLKSVKALVPQKLAFQAARIFKSEYQTDTANNNISAIYHDKYMPGGYIVNQFLSPNNWFILTDEPNGFKYYLRENLDIDFINDPITDNLTVRALERYSFGCSNWRAAVGVQLK